MLFRSRRVIISRKVEAPKPPEPKVVLPPRTVYFVNDGETVTQCDSVEEILEKFPTMNRRGVDAVLEGRQKSHVGYHIIKTVV